MVSEEESRKKLIRYLRQYADGSRTLIDTKTETLEEIIKLIDSDLFTKTQIKRITVRGLTILDLRTNIKAQLASRGELLGTTTKEKVAGTVIASARKRDEMVATAADDTQKVTANVIEEITGSKILGDTAGRLISGAFKEVATAAVNPIQKVKKVVLKFDRLLTGRQSDKKRIFSDWVKKSGGKRILGKRWYFLILFGTKTRRKSMRKLKDAFYKETGLKV